jgi:hypothetical protein
MLIMMANMAAETDNFPIGAGHGIINQFLHQESPELD